MNQNPKQILFYGDSITYGKKPGSVERYSNDTNFTGIIKKNLGADFNCIEEGLRARNLCGENEFFPERDGLQQFGPIFGSHIPLDLVVLMLGTNDCNRGPEKDATQIEKALDAYREKIEGWCKQLGITNIPKLLIVSPPHIFVDEVAKDAKMAKIFGPDAGERSIKLEKYFKEYCHKNNIASFDSSTVCVPAMGEGVHLDEENNRKLGEALTAEIRKLI